MSNKRNRRSGIASEGPGTASLERGMKSGHRATTHLASPQVTLLKYCNQFKIKPEFLVRSENPFVVTVSLDSIEFATCEGSTLGKARDRSASKTLEMLDHKEIPSPNTPSFHPTTVSASSQASPSNTTAPRPSKPSPGESFLVSEQTHEDFTLSRSLQNISPSPSVSSISNNSTPSSTTSSKGSHHSQSSTNNTNTKFRKTLPNSKKREAEHGNKANGRRKLAAVKSFSTSSVVGISGGGGASGGAGSSAISPLSPFSSLALAKTPTSVLYEFCMKNKLGTITFSERSGEGNKIHVIAVLLDGCEYGVGSGVSKVIAKHNASSQALQILNPSFASSGLAPPGMHAMFLMDSEGGAEEGAVSGRYSPRSPRSDSDHSAHKKGPGISVVSTSLGDAQYSAMLYALWQIDPRIIDPPEYSYSGKGKPTFQRNSFICSASVILCLDIETLSNSRPASTNAFLKKKSIKAGSLFENSKVSGDREEEEVEDNEEEDDDESQELAGEARLADLIHSVEIDQPRQESPSSLSSISSSKSTAAYQYLSSCDITPKDGDKLNDSETESNAGVNDRDDDDEDEGEDKFEDVRESILDGCNTEKSVSGGDFSDKCLDNASTCAVFGREGIKNEALDETEKTELDEVSGLKMSNLNTSSQFLETGKEKADVSPLKDLAQETEIKQESVDASSNLHTNNESIGSIELEEAELSRSLGAAQLEDSVSGSNHKSTTQLHVQGSPSPIQEEEASTQRYSGRSVTLTATGRGCTKKDAKHIASKELLLKLFPTCSTCEEALREAMKMKQKFSIQKRLKRHAVWEQPSPQTSGSSSHFVDLETEPPVDSVHSTASILPLNIHSHRQEHSEHHNQKRRRDETVLLDTVDSTSKSAEKVLPVQSEEEPVQEDDCAGDFEIEHLEVKPPQQKEDVPMSRETNTTQLSSTSFGSASLTRRVDEMLVGDEVVSSKKNRASTSKESKEE